MGLLSAEGGTPKDNEMGVAEDRPGRKGEGPCVVSATAETMGVA